MISDDPPAFERSQGHDTEIPFSQGDLHIQTRTRSGRWLDPPMVVPSGSAFWSSSPEATR